MEITKRQDKGVYIVQIQGELDMGTIDIFGEAMDNVQSDESKKGIVFDFKGLTFVDSTGVGKLLSYFYTFKEENMPYFLVNIKAEVKEIFEILGIPIVIGGDRFVEDEEQAMYKLISGL
jgi:anti-anti-sigma factor